MLCRRFAPLDREWEELYQQGCVGFMKAVNRFDPAMGVKFSTYAVPVILGEMRTLTRISAPCHIPRQDRELRARVRRAEALLRQQNHREPTVTELAMALRMDPAELTLAMEEIATVPLDAPLGGSTHPVAELIPDPQGESWLNKLLLQDMLERLPQRERKLLYLRWRQGLTQAETARALGMTQVQVSRAEMRLKSRLRPPMDGQRLRKRKTFPLPLAGFSRPDANIQCQFPDFRFAKERPLPCLPAPKI